MFLFSVPFSYSTNYVGESRIMFLIASDHIHYTLNLGFVWLMMSSPNYLDLNSNIQNTSILKMKILCSVLNHNIHVRATLSV